MKRYSLILWVSLVGALFVTPALAGSLDAGDTPPTVSGISSPDVLVKDVLLPAWRTEMLRQAKTWHLKGKLLLQSFAPEKPADDPDAKLASGENGAKKDKQHDDADPQGTI